jgi:hypothetical protein
MSYLDPRRSAIAATPEIRLEADWLEAARTRLGRYSVIIEASPLSELWRTPAA